jgi:Holliday junction resolvase-like predicted endonuclease
MQNVIKANGQREPFNEQKVISSIIRARIPKDLQPQVLAHVKSKSYEGIPTGEIYHHILEFLGESSHPYSRSSYSLKEAIMLLGPTGYPFEDFIAKILQALGYETKVRQILMGKCVSHEIDILATKGNKTTAIEAKFHNNSGTRSEVQVALYTQARFLDIKEKYGITDAWLVTNTKTTTDANTYALCSGLKVISWSFPQEGGLRDLIEKSRLHPITMLTSLPRSHKLTLLNNHIVMCKDIHNDHTILNQLPLSQEEKQRVINELAFICQTE